jgi:hypothetical protein
MRGREGAFIGATPFGVENGIWHCSEVFARRRSFEWPSQTLIAFVSPSSVDATESGEATFFSAVSSSYPSHSISWQKSTDGGESWQTISGSEGQQNLSLTGLNSQDSGSLYRAIATAGLRQSASAPASVFIEAAGSLSVEPLTIYLNESAGFTATFTATFTASRPSALLFWQDRTSSNSNWVVTTGRSPTSVTGPEVVVSGGELTANFSADITTTDQYRTIESNRQYRAVLASSLPFGNFISPDGVVSQPLSVRWDRLIFAWTSPPPLFDQVVIPYPDSLQEHETFFEVEAFATGQESGLPYPVEFKWQASKNGIDWFDADDIVFGTTPFGMPGAEITYPKGGGDKSRIAFKWTGTQTTNSISFRPRVRSGVSFWNAPPVQYAMSVTYSGNPEAQNL